MAFDLTCMADSFLLFFFSISFPSLKKTSQLDSTKFVFFSQVFVSFSFLFFNKEEPGRYESGAICHWKLNGRMGGWVVGWVGGWVAGEVEIKTTSASVEVEVELSGG